MKRRLLSAFLAVMMVLTMAPVAFAADTATSDGEALSKLFTDVHAGESGSGNVTVTIDKDYDLTGYQWTSLTVQGYTGAGVVTVEGNNHKITGLNAPLFAGGFAGTSGIVVKNLTLTNVNIKDSTSDQGIGAFINNVDSMPKIELDNCHLTDSSIDSNGGARVGGLIGWTSGYNKKNDGPVDTYITVTNCSVENTKITAAGSVGGIIGHAGANPATYHTFTNNTVTGCTLHSTDDGGWRVGVVVGTVNVGEVALNNTTESGNTVTQTGKTAPAGQSNLYGRFVPGTTGKLVIDGTAVFDSSIVAVVDNKGYKTLADAVAAAQGGATVKLLKDVTEDVVIPAGKTITLDLNGKKIVNSTTAQDSKVADDARKHTITNNGTLTIMDSVGGGVVDNVSHGRAALYNNGTITEIKGGKFTRSVDNSTDSESANGNSWYVVYNAEGATISKISNGEFLALGHFSSLFSNCGTIDEISGGMFTQDHFIAFKNEGTVNKISGGVFSSTDESCIQNWGTIGEICGGTITAGSLGIWNFSSDKYQSKGTVEKISDGVISGTKAAIRLSNYDVEYLNKSANDLKNWASATIVGGKINGALKVGNGTRVSISGGYFTVDPSAYCVTGKTGVSSGDSTYPWTVGEKIANTKPAEVADATVAATVDKNASEAAKDAAKDIGGATMAQNEAIKAATKNEANKNTIEPTTKVEGNKTVTDKLKAALPTGTTVSDSDVKIVYQTYIDVEVKDAAQENSNFTELTVELTPMYRVIAAQRGVTDYHVDVDKNTSSVNAVQIVGEKPLTLTGKYEVTLQLPNGFVVPSDNKLSIKHQKSSGVEYYTGTVDTTSAAKMVTFETNGFSPFTISAVAAYVGTTAYPTLQEAANAANSGDTIVVKNGASHDLTFTATKSVKVKNETGADVTVKFNGTDKKFGNGETETFSYTKPSSSSGGSSSGKTTFKVVTSAVNNGGVNASPSNAEKGATITITLSPDKGYKLDKLTVTDGSGKTVSTVKKSDTVYTFTMPASAVKVGVSYVKATETPSETKFNDVSANDWFASAVDYVTGKGMMNGTADNTFSPKANTTRGMVVTVLYRLENQPSTSAASFTDVASGAYYANAVAWANANGIVSGYGSGKFGPNDKVTREQLAAILYRYAQYKKYDVSVGEDTNILSYDDAQSISSYAIPAIQWACGAGVVTGKSGSKLDPKGNATRAEVAAMLMRFCENVK